MLAYRRNAIWAERSRRGFEELKQRVGADSLNSGAESPTTKNDRQLHATNVLFETSARLDSGAIILDLCKDLLTDDGASKTMRKRMATTIKNLLIPMQRIASELLADAAKKHRPSPRLLRKKLKV